MMRFFPYFLIMLGVIFVALSLLWPAIANSRASWSSAQAQEYAETSAALHEAAHDHAGKVTTEQFVALQARFEKNRTALEHAQQEPQRWSRILLWSGAALAGAGGLMHLSRQSA